MISDVLPDYSLGAWTKIRGTLKSTGDPLSKWTELGAQLIINNSIFVESLPERHKIEPSGFMTIQTQRRISMKDDFKIISAYIDTAKSFVQLSSAG